MQDEGWKYCRDLHIAVCKGSFLNSRCIGNTCMRFNVFSRVSFISMVVRLDALFTRSPWRHVRKVAAVRAERSRSRANHYAGFASCKRRLLGWACRWCLWQYWDSY